ncbi:MAG: hypothetical protein JW717_03170 [Marinilabiliaceae bacterium]|nr:hypothetical protein [Marinilabiliaceae bacterium]
MRTINKDVYFLMGLFFLVLYYTPFFVFYKNSFILIHDNLDCLFNLQIIPNYISKSGRIEQFMNGISSDMFPLSLNFTSLLLTKLDPFIGYLINDFFVRVIGFIGMFLLLDIYIIKKHLNNRNIYISSIALIYSLIGSYNIYGLTIMGQPLLLLMFIDIYKGNIKWWKFLIIFLFAFWSSLIYIGVFICIILSGVWLHYFIKNKKQLNTPFLLSILTLIVGYIISEHHLIMSNILASDIINHRVEWSIKPLSISQNIQKIFWEFSIFTQRHSGRFCTILIVFTTLLSIIFSKKIDKLTSYLLIIISNIIFFVFIFHYIKVLFGSHIILLKIFQWDRFYFFLPTLWIILFANSIQQISLSKAFRNNALCFFLLFTMIINVSLFNKELRTNIYHFFSENIKYPTYKQYFDIKLFNNIKKEINKDQDKYKVVSLGLHPSIAFFNGFYCIDGYTFSYPLAHKHKFRKIIEKELNKDKTLKDYFDNWGSRCYLFSSELKQNYLFGKDNNKEITNLSIDINQFKKMGGHYIISSVKVNNINELGLVLDKTFEGEFWKIYLYRAL